MPEGFRPPPPDATHGIRRSEVPPEVAAYADNLMLQLDEIVARYGISNFRAAMEIPDGERFERLEAVMDLGDLDRYRELIVGYQQAVRSGRVPTTDRAWRLKITEARTKEAVEAMGAGNVLGPEKAATTFGLDLESLDVPPVPFSRAELERARNLNQFLVFRVSKAADGTPLSMAKMSELLMPRFAAEKKNKVFSLPAWDKVEWQKDEQFYTDDVPADGWALVTRGIVPGSSFRSFRQQTEDLVRYLRESVYKGFEMPKKYVDAIAQFDAMQADPALVALRGKERALLFESLGTTNLLRQSPVEAAYDALLEFDQTGSCSLARNLISTSRSRSDGRLVVIGYFGKEGLQISRYEYGDTDGGLGAVMSRR